jgi:hypothetical protein
MKKIQIFCLLSLLLTLNSCETQSYAKFSSSREPITQSLFNATDRTINEEDIKKLLDGDLRLPDTLRVAIYKFGTTNRSFQYGNYGYGEENSVKAHQSFVDTLVANLEGNAKVKQVNIIPSLMLSAQPTITQLREAAVRLQSDILLVFSSSSDIYYKSKVLKKDETKAYATTEAFIMDIRTGLVPFSTMITKDFLTTKMTVEQVGEVRQRAQRLAVLLTLDEVGKKVNLFLKKQ